MLTDSGHHLALNIPRLRSIGVIIKVLLYGDLFALVASYCEGASQYTSKGKKGTGYEFHVDIMFVVCLRLLFGFDGL